MTEQITSYLCCGAICGFWPLLWFTVGVNVGRHGWRGWLRILTLRAKAWGGSDA